MNFAQQNFQSLLEASGDRELQVAVAQPDTSNLAIAAEFDSKPTTALISHPICSQHNTIERYKLENVEYKMQVPCENVNRLRVLLDDRDGSLRTSRLRRRLVSLEAQK